MNSTKFPRGNLQKLWRTKTDKKRAFSTDSNGNAAGTGAGCRVAGMPSCSGTLGQPAELPL